VRYGATTIVVVRRQRVKYPACKAHVPYCHLWTAQLHNIFPYCLIHGGGMCVLNFSTNFFRNSEVCHPRCVFKLYGEVSSVKNTTIKYG